MPNSDYEKLLNYSFRLLSRKRYTVSEINKKLKLYSKRRSIESLEDINKVINRLFELRYLNDEEFIKDFVKSRINYKPRGKILIRRELLLKGIKKDTLDQIIDQEDIDEEKIGATLLEKKMHRWKNLDKYKQREKAFQLLSRKGLCIDSIYKTLDRYYNRRVEVGS